MVKINMKEKISVSIDEELVEKIDNLIGEKNIQNRSQSMEYLIKKTLERKEVKKAVVLAGGGMEKLKRNNDLKPLAKVDGKIVIKNIIKMLKETGIEEVIMLAGPITDKIFQTVGDGSEYGIRIKYIEEGKNLGTGGALKLAEKYIENTFITVYGDEYFNFNLKNMINFHKDHNGFATALIAATNPNESKDEVELEGDKIKKFKYLPKGGNKTYHINAGIYLFEPNIFDFIPERGSLEEDVLPKLAKKGKLWGYNFTGEWKHID